MTDISGNIEENAAATISGNVSPNFTLSGMISQGTVIIGDYTVTISDIEGGHRLTVLSVDGHTQFMDVMDGVDGQQGIQGLPGPQGEPGLDAPQIDDTQASAEHPWSGAKTNSELETKIGTSSLGSLLPDSYRMTATHLRFTPNPLEKPSVYHAFRAEQAADDPSIDNPTTFTGLTNTMSVIQTDFNFLDNSQFEDMSSPSHYCEILDNGRVHFVNNDGATFEVSAQTVNLPAGEYRIQVLYDDEGLSGASKSYSYTTSDHTTKTWKTSGTINVTLSNPDMITVHLRTNNNEVGTFRTNINVYYLDLGSPSSYLPNYPRTITYTFPEYIFRGEARWTNTEHRFVLTYRHIEITGNEEWSDLTVPSGYSSYVESSIALPDSKIQENPMTVYCTHLPSYSTAGGAENINIINGRLIVRILASRLSSQTLAAFKTFIGSLHMGVGYSLGSPYPDYDIPDLDAITGENNIFSTDGRNIQVISKEAPEALLKDTRQRITDVANKIGYVTAASSSTITLHNHETVYRSLNPSTVYLPTPVSGEECVCGLTFKAVSSIGPTIEPPTGHTLKWVGGEPTWTSGKIYELIFRCLWVDNVFSVKWSEVS